MEEWTTQKEKLENEQSIVERAKIEDQAFEILYNHYFPKIYGYIFKRTGNHEVTEDLVSITMMKVFCNIKNYKHKGYSFGAWVYRIATNNLVDYYRKKDKKKEISIEEIENKEDEGDSAYEKAKSADKKKIVKLTLIKLSKRHQEILHLKFFAELANDEIAQTLDISVNNTRVLVHRALKNFHKIYKKYDK